MTKIHTLDDLTFDNRFVEQLPADSKNDNVCRQVVGACYSRVLPTAVRAPHTIIVAREVADLLDLSDDVCASEDFTQVFSGNRVTHGMQPYAMCYGGHQFGQWAGQLGDGRAINLGEVVNAKKEHWTVQLKGAGKTPYSRQSDGLAVLRSSVREFICSEAMFHLGVPTTRALSLVLTGEKVWRDMFYDGRGAYESGAIVCRVAPSFTRFGHFQLFSSRGDIALLKQLVDFTIRTDFPQLGEPSVAVYLKWFSQVCLLTAQMVVHWQRVGFVHGVMNTDNMSILGLTIDYGPYGWLEDVDLKWTPNTTDGELKRYCFGNQPKMAFWNLAQLANAIFPLIGDAAPLQATLNEHYTQHFQHGWQSMMVEKLGLPDFQAAADERLLSELMHILQLTQTDMTLFYRQLAKVDFSVAFEALDLSPLDEAYYVPTALDQQYKNVREAWLARYYNRLRDAHVSETTRVARMNAINPLYVPRNYLLQNAIDDANNGNFEEIHQLLDVFRAPYEENSQWAKYSQKRPAWANEKAGCSMLSCSS
ncbi:MAG: serine/tyrosine/threonine adenylyltransferase [Pseudomonadota bacterium]|nr:serine/tyrosine/threonine adenylyltransferase [Pseudomonadota bacterium]